MKEALYWEKQDDKAKCALCPHNCAVAEGKTGICGARRNSGGALYSLNYARVTSVSMDPVEKKPLYHFHPGSAILSMGTAGCNFRCGFCQNYSISQDAGSQTEELAPGQAVGLALKHKSFGLCYTYNEPFIWFEFVLETAKLARKAGLKNVLVTNGFVNSRPLEEVLPFIDAANIDLKSMDEDFYKKICGGRLEPVLDTIRTMRGKAHIELTNLVIPTLNDSAQQLSALVDWVAGLDPDIPLHFSRYFPCYKMDIPPTPEATLKKAREIAIKKLRHVYIGNVCGPETDATYCCGCKKPVIERSGFSVVKNKVKDGKCGYCGGKVSIIQ